MEEKYKEMIIENSQSCKSAHHRIDKLENMVQTIQDLAVSVKEIAMETKKNREDVNKMDSRLEEIEKKPAKNWDNLWKTIRTRNCYGNSGFFLGEIRNVRGDYYAKSI